MTKEKYLCRYPKSKTSLFWLYPCSALVFQVSSNKNAFQCSRNNRFGIV